MSDIVNKNGELQFLGYDFMCLFCATLGIQKMGCFNCDNLVEFIDDCQQRGKYDQLLSRINVKDEGYGKYSTEIEDALSKLRLAKIVYPSSNKRVGVVTISEKMPIAELINPLISYLNPMVEFTSEFRNYEFRKNQSAYAKIGEREQSSKILVKSNND